ncbi:MAG: type II toxin-antitoxin system death-on-curing family toxin [Candidatus Binataceae bacterium]
MLSARSDSASLTSTAGSTASATPVFWTPPWRARGIFSHTDGATFSSSLPVTHLVSRNHPFNDGNKRIAFMAAYIFLVRNCYQPEMEETETVLQINALAAGGLSEEELGQWLRRSSRPLRSPTRQRFS